MANEPDGSDPKGTDGGGNNGFSQSDIDALKADFEAKLAKKQEIIDAKVAGKKELEDQLKADAERRGEYDKALELVKGELATKEAAISELTEKLDGMDTFKVKAEEWDKYQDTKRAELLERLPEDKRETFQTASLDLLETTVGLLGGKPGTHKAGAAPPGNLDGKKWADMSQAEKAGLIREDPTRARKLQAEYINENT